MLQRGTYDEGMHLLIHPRDNHLVTAAADAYQNQLTSAVSGLVPFVTHTLERVIEALDGAGAKDYARALHRRYADFWLIDGELQLDEIAEGEGSNGIRRGPAEGFEADERSAA